MRLRAALSPWRSELAPDHVHQDRANVRVDAERDCRASQKYPSRARTLVSFARPPGRSREPGGRSGTGRTPGPASSRDGRPTRSPHVRRGLLGKVLQLPVEERERATLRVGGGVGGGGGV